MKQVYLISGLGADERVFQKLDFKNHQTHNITWIKPKPNESIELYAARLINQIKTPKPILVGLSFGGIMAIEIARQIPIEKIILLASVKTKSEISKYFQLAGKWRFNRLIPTFFLNKTNALLNWVFGVSEIENKKLLRSIINDTDVQFAHWAIQKIMNWSNTQLPNNTFHIHGDKDRIFPIKNIQTDLIIKGGGHFMTIQNHEEINQMIHQIINVDP